MGRYLEKVKELEESNTAAPPGNDFPPPTTLSDKELIKKALRERGIAAIQSDALDGEVIYFAKDMKAAQKAPVGAVAYTLDELRAIVQDPPSKEGLKQIHSAKKLFNGQVICRD